MIVGNDNSTKIMIGNFTLNKIIKKNLANIRKKRLKANAMDGIFIELDRTYVTDFKERSAKNEFWYESWQPPN